MSDSARVHSFPSDTAVGYVRNRTVTSVTASRIDRS